jgi:hypothetical protein
VTPCSRKQKYKNTYRFESKTDITPGEGDKLFPGLFTQWDLFSYFNRIPSLLSLSGVE